MCWLLCQTLFGVAGLSHLSENRIRLTDSSGALKLNTPTCTRGDERSAFTTHLKFTSYIHTLLRVVSHKGFRAILPTSSEQFSPQVLNRFSPQFQRLLTVAFATVPERAHRSSRFPATFESLPDGSEISRSSTVVLRSYAE